MNNPTSNKYFNEITLLLFITHVVIDEKLGLYGMDPCVGGLNLQRIGPT